MYYDLGYSDWIFEIEETTGTQIANRLTEMGAHYSDAKKKVITSLQEISDIYKKACVPISNLLYQ